MAFPATLSPDSIRALRDVLGWSPARLAEELGVTPLTIHRWEKPARQVTDSQQNRERGRPVGIPHYVGLALSYLMFREGLSATTRQSVTVALPRALGSLLPLWAKKRELDLAFGLKFEVSDVETGTDALSAIAAGKAQVAGAARGLIRPFRNSVVEVGILLRSSRAFTVLFGGSDGQKFGAEEKHFLGPTILFPEGSDLGNILERSLTPHPSKGPTMKTLSVSISEARIALAKDAKALKRDKEGPRAMFIAWEPLVSKLREELESSTPLPSGSSWKIQGLPESFKDLDYEFHLLCSRSWATEHPALALNLMLCLAQADLDFVRQPIAAIQHVWENYKLSKRDELQCRQDLDNHRIAYRPSAQLLQLIRPRQVAVVDRNDLVTRQ